MSHNFQCAGRHPSPVAALTAARGTRPIRRASSSPTRSPTTGCCGGRATCKDHNSYPGSTTAPMWNPFSYRFNGIWHAPAGLVVGGSYSIVSGGWSSSDRRPAAGQQPATGARSVRRRWSRRPGRCSRIRCARASASSYPTRGEGQVRLPATQPSGSSWAGGSRSAATRDRRSRQPTSYNLLNAGRGTEYARGGANRRYNTAAYLQPGNLQAPRAASVRSDRSGSSGEDVHRDRR